MSKMLSFAAIAGRYELYQAHHLPRKIVIGDQIFPPFLYAENDSPDTFLRVE